MRIVTFGDQLVASPGKYDGNFHVPPGDHWWELLAKDLDCESVLLKQPSNKNTDGISPLYYCSTILKETLKSDDFFVGIMPSANRSTKFEGEKGPVHLVSTQEGHHLNLHYQKWQKDLAIKVLELWSKHNNCFFFIMESSGEYGTLDSNKFYVLPDIDPNDRYDMNHLWKWVMVEHPELSHPGHFYQNCAPDRKLNRMGNKYVYEVLKKYLNNVLDFDNKKII